MAERLFDFARQLAQASGQAFEAFIEKTLSFIDGADGS